MTTISKAAPHVNGANGKSHSKGGVTNLIIHEPLSQTAIRPRLSKELTEEEVQRFVPITHFDFEFNPKASCTIDILTIRRGIGVFFNQSLCDNLDLEPMDGQTVQFRFDHPLNPTSIVMAVTEQICDLREDFWVLEDPISERIDYKEKETRPCYVHSPGLANMLLNIIGCKEDEAALMLGSSVWKEMYWKRQSDGVEHHRYWYQIFTDSVLQLPAGQAVRDALTLNLHKFQSA